MFSQVGIVCLVACVVSADVSSFYPRLGGHTNAVDFDPNPQYTYSYSVNDAHTGDNHAQEETRNGDNVHGSYSLIEADGSLRTVKYTADAVNGFTAVVEHSGGASRTFGAPSHRITPVAAYAPIAAAPAYVAPIAAAPAYVAPKLAIPAQTYALRGSGASVHTSFSAPHASYQY